jgi:tRNA(Ile)-lysidine synthase
VVSLTKRVAQAIETHGLLAEGACVVVAVSGGLDSIVLLQVLHEMSRSRAWRLVVAHFNHQLRGKASAADARFVKRTAEALDIEFRQERADTAAFARAQGISVEMGARVLRHSFLARAAKEVQASAVALAHHADDQLELFFLRLLRGAGAEGLSGMNWQGVSPEDRGVRLIRPLLGERRVVLEAYARSRRLAFREDSTNQDVDIMRNRIRHELLPLLRERYQPGLDDVIARTMTAFRDMAALVNDEAEGWRQARRRKPFGRLPVALQRRVLSIGLRDLKVPVTFELVERLRLAEGERISAGTNRFVARDKSGFVLETGAEQAEENCGEQMRLDLSGGRGVEVFGGIELRWRLVALRSASYSERAGGQVMEVFDADKVGRVIVLRHWRRGDRFQPSGLGRPARLQNLFVNQRIPRELRRRLVIAATSAGTIFWVEGLRISEGFKLDKTSRRGLKWAWHRAEIPSKGPVAPASGPW